MLLCLLCSVFGCLRDVLLACDSLVDVLMLTMVILKFPLLLRYFDVVPT